MACLAQQLDDRARAVGEHIRSLFLARHGTVVYANEVAELFSIAEIRQFLYQHAEAMGIGSSGPAARQEEDLAWWQTEGTKMVRVIGNIYYFYDTRQKRGAF